jgi:hypothetical protein
VVEQLPSKSEVLNSNPQYYPKKPLRTQKNKNDTIQSEKLPRESFINALVMALYLLKDKEREAIK